MLAFDLRRHAKRDRDPIPAIDGNRGSSEVDDLFFGEFLTRDFENVIGYVALRHQRDGLYPAQGGTLTRTVERRFAPGVEQVHALVGFAELSCVARVRRKTIGATVDLRDADLDQLAQFRIKAGLVDL